MVVVVRQDEIGLCRIRKSPAFHLHLRQPHFSPHFSSRLFILAGTFLVSDESEGFGVTWNLLEFMGIVWNPETEYWAWGPRDMIS